VQWGQRRKETTPDIPRLQRGLLAAEEGQVATPSHGLSLWPVILEIEHSTPNVEVQSVSIWMLGVECWLLGVEKRRFRKGEDRPVA